MAGVLLRKDRDTETGTQGEDDHEMLEAETAVMHLQTEECHGLPANPRS